MKKQFRSFKEARKYVHSLKLKNASEWREFYISDARPSDIPTAPNVVYKSEWNGWGDWLDTGTISPREKSKKYLSFEKSRDFVHSLKLKNKQEWQEYCNSNKKLDAIPASPWNIYKNKGWISLDNFLGHDRISNSSKQFLSFEQARSIVRKLGLDGEKEWRKYCKSGKKPKNIPYHPERTYKNKGWIIFGDFFGTDNVHKKQYRSFEDARSFVSTLGLKNEAEWRMFSTSKKKPDDIPANPRGVYKKEWNGLGNWLGTGTIAYQNREWLPWKKAKSEYQKLIKENNIQTLDQWRQFLKTHKLPQNLPSRPDYVYSKENIMRRIKE